MSIFPFLAPFHYEFSIREYVNTLKYVNSSKKYFQYKLYLSELYFSKKH